jgi:DNA-binding NarL/FixJ family response regulator
MTNAIRVLTVDDHPLLREGIASLLADEPDMVLVGEARDGQEAIQQFRCCHPDVTLMDLRMPGMSGLDALMAIRQEFPEARIIVLTTYSGDVEVLTALRAGASGYLLKNALRQELPDAIRAVRAGRKALSAEASFAVAEHTGQEMLSPAEIRVLQLIAEGHSNKEIGATLSTSEDAVKGQVKSILAKLGAYDRTHAVTIGVKRGILQL